MDRNRTSQPSATKPRRKPLFRIEAEVLEGRQLLTGGAGNTIALTRGSVDAAGGTATAQFSVEKTHFASPSGRLTLGVDVVANSGSTVSPIIKAITPAAGSKGSGATIQSISPDGQHAVFASVVVPKKGTATSTVKVKAQNSTKGDFLLGYYLPGDVDGDGKVTKTDLAAIKAQVGKTVSDSDYNFEADSNRDGAITRADLTLAKKNLGASTTITPDFTANLDPATDTGAADRITNQPAVKFTGQAAPDAAISFKEVNGKSSAASTTADASGNYSVTLNLAQGTSTYQVTSVDGFGQTIQGSIQPVTYTTGTVPAAKAATSTSTTTS